MTDILKARVAETTTTTGTGAITLAGAVDASHIAFSSVCSVNDTVDYVIYACDATTFVPSGDWEEGKGTYSGADTLTRTTVKSSSTGSAIDFAAGTKVVILSPNAERLAFIKRGGVAGDVLLKSSSTDFAAAWTSFATTVRATVLTGLSTAAGTVVEATHTVLEAIGFLQKQVSDNATAITGKAATGAVGSSGLTMATNKLLGRGTAATGAIEEIVLGTNLSFTGTTLNAAGGSGTGTKTFAVFSPLANQPPATVFATLDTRNSVPVLDFDAATDESAIFSGVVSEAATLTSGIVANIVWMATSATSGNVRWRVAFERRTTDQDADSFDTATEATSAANGTSGICTVEAITCTTIDSIVAGDSFRVRITRVGSDATNDTATGDAELVAVELRAA